jgi:hypothetical protein
VFSKVGQDFEQQKLSERPGGTMDGEIQEQKMR